MLRDHAVARGNQFLQRWKLRTIKAPIRMRDEFFIALVLAVDRVEKCLRVADMNAHGNSESPAFLPHRVDARIINRDKLARFIADTKP